MDPDDKAITSFGYSLEGSQYGDQDNGQMTWFNSERGVGGDNLWFRAVGDVHDDFCF